jgi:predicted amidophosphoribosyltransferase
MSLRVACCFSLLTGPDGWQDSHHCVKQFVDALKGRRLIGYAYVQVSASAPRRRLEQANASNAIEWFGEMSAGILAGEPDAADPVLVPIPDSRCVVGSPRSRTWTLADAIRRHTPGAEVLDVIRFDSVMHSAHANQGARDAQSLYLHMRLQKPVRAGRPYVLVDDVVTTGGHMQAAAAVLRQHGAEVVVAICAASADRTPRVDPFACVTRHLGDYVPPASALAPRSDARR